VQRAEATRIALIRGINVGRAKRVAMADLRKLVEKLGYGDVRTLLNSGNVVFTAPSSVRGDAAARIEEEMSRRLGVSAGVIVVTAVELAEAVEENPIREMDREPSRSLIAFFRGPAERKLLLPLAKQRWTPEKLAIGKNVAYLWCPEGVLESDLLTAVGRALGDAVTTRNWATVRKLRELSAS
jgi:uncharacterized protein (DUF1697 family)